MSRAPKKPPLALDMEFDEALRRFARTDPAELPDGVKLNRKRRTNKPDSGRIETKP